MNLWIQCWSSWRKCSELPFLCFLSGLYVANHRTYSWKLKQKVNWLEGHRWLTHQRKLKGHVRNSKNLESSWVLWAVGNWIVLLKCHHRDESALSFFPVPGKGIGLAWSGSHAHCVAMGERDILTDSSTYMVPTRKKLLMLSRKKIVAGSSEGAGWTWKTHVNMYVFLSPNSGPL